MGSNSLHKFSTKNKYNHIKALINKDLYPLSHVFSKFITDFVDVWKTLISFSREIIICIWS